MDAAPRPRTVRRTGAPADGPLWTGTLGAGSRGDIHARALAQYAGAPPRPLGGYTGLFELARSLENGELDAACGWPLRDIKTRHADWLRDGRMELFAQFSKGPQQLGPIPHARDLATSSQGRAVLDALETESLLAWPLAAPPNMDPALTALMRKAFAALGEDKDARQDAAPAGVALEPVSGEVVEGAVRVVHGVAGRP